MLVLLMGDVQGNVVTLCSDNCLHLWEIAMHDGASNLDYVKSLPLENRYKRCQCDQLVIKLLNFWLLKFL